MKQLESVVRGRNRWNPTLRVVILCGERGEESKDLPTGRCPTLGASLFFAARVGSYEPHLRIVILTVKVVILSNERSEEPKDLHLLSTGGNGRLCFSRRMQTNDLGMPPVSILRPGILKTPTSRLV